MEMIGCLLFTILIIVVAVILVIRDGRSFERKQLAMEFCIDRGNGIYMLYIYSSGNPIKDGSDRQTIEDALDQFLIEHPKLKIVHIEKSSKRDATHFLITDLK